MTVTSLIENTPERIKRNITTVLLIALIVFASSPVLSPINFGHDLAFHLYRIQGISDALKDGVFPVRMQYSQMYGMGYPASIMYPDAFLYIPAVLSMFGLSVTLSYRIFVFVLNVFVVVVTYILVKRFSNSRAIAFAVSCVWVLGTYRLVDVYLRGSVGEYTALAFFPLIAYGLWCAFTKRGRSSTKIHPSLWIAFGMTGVVLSHVLSVLLAVFALVGVLIVLAIKGDAKKSGWTSLVCGCGLTFVLAAWYVIPFLDWYSTQDMQASTSYKSELEHLRKMSASLGQLFALFPTMAGGSDNNTTGGYHRMPLSLGVGALCFLLLGIMCILVLRGSKALKGSIENDELGSNAKVLVFFLVCLCACIIPCCFSFVWREGIPFIKKLAVIQFPWRFLGPIMFISVLVGLIALKVMKDCPRCSSVFHLICAVVCVLTILEAGHSMSSVSYEIGSQTSIETMNEIVTDTSDISGGEYLPTDVTLQSIMDKKEAIASGDLHFGYTSHSDGGRVFDVEFSEPQTKSNVELPLIYYDGYEIVSQETSKIEIGCSDDGFVELKLPQNYSGTVSIKWVEPNSWHAAELISLISLLLVVSLIVVKQCKLKKERTSGDPENRM